MFDHEIVRLHIMVYLAKIVTYRDWFHIFDKPILDIHIEEVREFYVEMSFFPESTSLITKVKEVEIRLDEKFHGQILEVPI